MADYTPTLGLRKPTRLVGTDDIIDVTLDVNAPLDTIDQNINLRLTTSSTRPSNPFTGMLILETDTFNIYVWSGTTWDYAGNNNSAKGKIGLSTSTSSGTARAFGDAEISYLPITWAAVDGRRYWIEGHYYATASVISGTGRFATSFRWAVGNSVTNTDTNLGSLGLDINVAGSLNGEWITVIYELVPGVTGNVTASLFYTSGETGDTVQVVGNAGSPTRLNWISVRDVGV